MDTRAPSFCTPALARLLRLLAPGPPPEPADLGAWRDADWADTIQVAEGQRLAPLLYRRLQDAALPAPDALLARLRRGYLHVAADNMRRLAALEEALQALSAAGVQVILLKGAYLAPLVYGNIALRPMVDLDLLVREGDADRAVSALADLDYAPLAGGAWMGDRYGHHGLRRSDGLLLELHQRLGAMAVGARIDPDQIWQRARPAPVGQAMALALEPTDLLLHLCTHTAAQHLLQLGLLPLYDIRQVLAQEGAQIEAQELARRARLWRVARAAYLVLTLAQRLLAAPVSQSILASLAPPDGEAHVEAAMGTLLSEEAPEDLPSSNLVALWGARRWQARLGVLWRVLLPDAERMRALYGISPGAPVAPWLYLRRWADLLTRRRASIRQLRGSSAVGVDWQALVRWLAQG